MKRRLLQTLLVIALVASAAGTWRFSALVIHEYEHAQAVVLTLNSASTLIPRVSSKPIARAEWKPLLSLALTRFASRRLWVRHWHWFGRFVRNSERVLRRPPFEADYSAAR
jgi:hypothetical protein